MFARLLSAWSSRMLSVGGCFMHTFDVVSSIYAFGFKSYSYMKRGMRTPPVFSHVGSHHV